VETTPKSILLSGTAEGVKSFVRESEPPNKTQGDRRLERFYSLGEAASWGTVDSEWPAGIVRPASVYRPKRRTVAMASNEVGIHIPFTSANCRVI